VPAVRSAEGKSTPIENSPPTESARCPSIRVFVPKTVVPSTR